MILTIAVDIVYPNSRHSCCFTRAYSHKVEGAGSVLQLGSKDLLCDINDPASLIPLKLRYFTPLEIANIYPIFLSSLHFPLIACSRIHGFPPTFVFAPSVTLQQSYRLIGNSLNVVVVAELIKYLLASQ